MVVGLGRCRATVILVTSGKEKLQKRFYILFVARGDDGQLRKIPIPVHYLYVLVVGAVIVGRGRASWGRGRPPTRR